ncbi:1-aminocyclopropane-1-carboxylate deaminase/D-cysteine desulfhydrase [Frigoriflavimonas asaccharolytica]|uniref:1-aminocyclopropane-1-carboxylate deaminase n=1 Tax=Frigoriflavimonas asaccharolytica TaxID=2735899 RepID=A0A8J8GAP6_9FLAO|nr:pyridoxal-phosphate dependent enzyme [Frigoriflavimonas asaccharolytica]NRS93087.1 1-aminocyclopropane-1-carboxylate deaminase [Frigoriflavimonas asaccharolytica]
MKFPQNSAPLIHLYSRNGVQVHMKREDLVHPEISGNKFWKLFYTIQNYQNEKKEKPLIITFGGAFSNHIAAVAKVGQLENIPTLGIIRGDELEKNWQKNPTLKLAHENGMNFRFVNRETYRNKESLSEKLLAEFPQSCIIPEGGTNDFAVKGIQHMLNFETEQFDYLCSAVGTGGTLAGISKFCKENQQVLGFSVVKDLEQKKLISQLSGKRNFELVDATFGGYGKINEDLIYFINSFKKEFKIQLDAIYTGKMMQKLQMMIDENYFPQNTKIVAFHTGGLQGNFGVNLQLTKKKKVLLNLEH